MLNWLRHCHVRWVSAGVVCGAAHAGGGGGARDGGPVEIGSAVAAGKEGRGGKGRGGEGKGRGGGGEGREGGREGGGETNEYAQFVLITQGMDQSDPLESLPHNAHTCCVLTGPAPDTGHTFKQPHVILCLTT